jgi:hypothetical protein
LPRSSDRTRVEGTKKPRWVAEAEVEVEVEVKVEAEVETEERQRQGVSDSKARRDKVG